MHPFLITLFFVFAALCGSTQTVVDNSISPEKARQHIEFLAADSLMGRGNGTPGIRKAAEYIAHQFREAGLVPLPGTGSFFQPFMLDQRSRIPLPVFINWGNQALEDHEVRWFGPSPWAPMQNTALHPPLVMRIRGRFEADLFLRNWPGTEDVILWSSDRPRRKKDYFPAAFQMPAGGLSRNFLLVYADTAQGTIEININPAYAQRVGHNIVGSLPGSKSRHIDLLVGAHYDHIGIDRRQNDPVMNGANDNASGTTALLMLAAQFGQHPVAEKNIVFVAFAGEELGLFGSEYMAGERDRPSITAMLNLEMLGIPQFGERTVFITGESKSRFARQLSGHLKEAGLHIIPEPGKDRQLYQRSDNFSFAEKGVPAHTVMASDDLDDCYHRPCDEAARINCTNLTEITEAIARAIRNLL